MNKRKLSSSPHCQQYFKIPLSDIRYRFQIYYNVIWNKIYTWKIYYVTHTRTQYSKINKIYNAIIDKKQANFSH